MNVPIEELPQSLQTMITDCRNAIADWDQGEDADDPIAESLRKWLLKLSRGEFEDHLYWECVADDCEEAGDWDGALSAYRKILGIPDSLGTTHSKALSAIAFIQRLQGHSKAALKSFHWATAKSTKQGVVMGHMRLLGETSQLIRMGRIRRARKLLARALAQDPNEFVDHLGTSLLLVDCAKCELTYNNPNSAAQYLECAWEWLDALVQSCASAPEFLRQASGVHIAYAGWWTTEAKRSRMAGENDSEVVALKQAIEKVRLCFTPCGFQRPWYDLRLMNLLLQLADACERRGLPMDAGEYRREADEIFLTRRFPSSAKWPRYDDWRPSRLAFLRNWRQIFHRR